METLSMQGKTIFITGGNAGIGLATAILFARQGCNVGIIGRRAEENRKARKLIEQGGGQCLDFAGSVTDENALRGAIQGAAQAFGGLHFAFNNAGVEEAPGPFTAATVESYHKIMDVNVMGVWLAMREEIPLIQESGGGCIVNTASVAGHIGMANVPIYVASKHAVVGLTKAAAMEYAKSNVRINAVAPAAVRTDLFERFTGKDAQMEQMIEGLHPMGRTGTPQEVAAGVLFLCRDATWTTGLSLALDGGFMVS
jgi:NAD(P)-dependent dehydrogenase (short-subunit alcohol dehydrogenase family)